MSHTPGHLRASAESIVRAIDSREQLLAACSETVQAIETILAHWGERSPEAIQGELRDVCSECLQPAIAKAKGETS
jgi:hypothetical protein